MDSNSRYQPNSGLLRFRSAPTSVLASFKGDHSHHCQDSEPVFRFFDSGEQHETASPPSLREFVDSNNKLSSDKSESRNNNTNHNHGDNSNSNNAPNGSFMSPSTLRLVNSEQRYGASVLPSPRYPSQNSSAVVGSVGMDQFKGFEFDSHLLRQNSLRSDNFSNNFSFQNGYDTVKAVGNYGGVNGNDDELSLSMNRMKNQISFTSMLTQTSKMGVDGIGATAPDEGRQGCSNGDAPYYSLGFPFGSWNETSHLSNKLIGSKRQRNSNDELLSDAQNGDLGTQVHTLSHHLSLPRSSSEMFSVENLLQFPDSVPCKIRAKRGFATHPRSIAERVRRTRISERIRKLQELVPNMEKQTSTADMLDLAVDYIKDLQKQFKSLSDKRAKCKCIKMKKSETDQVA